MKTLAACLLALPMLIVCSSAQELTSRTGSPYLGAIVTDAETGEVLFEDKADAQGYPASVIKLMDLLIVLDYVEQGALSFGDQIKVTAEASTMGGSQVYLAEKEVFSLDEMLYALMVQSANDAAVALAIHISGTKDGFVALMNERAAEIGMSSTSINSVHGLPPGKEQKPDVTTARDLAILARQVLKKKDALRYTSTRERGFRNDTFIMRNHNPLLSTFDGCDGLKTGYYKKAGFSIAATAERNGVRLIAIVLGSPDKNTRNAKAAELLSRGFLEHAKRRQAGK